MQSGVSIIKDNLAKVMKSVAALTQSKVMVGIPSKAARRKDKAPINNAAIGYINEKGAPELNIPARPHLVPGVRDAQKDITRLFKSGTIAMLGGDKTGFTAAQNAAGLVAVSAVRAKITSNIPPELAALTIINRQRKGRTGETPLIDTGQYRQAQTYVIREV